MDIHVFLQSWQAWTVEMIRLIGVILICVGQCSTLFELFACSEKFVNILKEINCQVIADCE